MKVVILAGGFGTRLSEYTKKIPKPMVKIAGKPLIFYIMKHYSNHGFKNFIIATGYKEKIIKNFFTKKILDWNVDIINTGLDTMTGGRIKRLQKSIGENTFLMTYGDGLCDINIKNLIKFHKKSKCISTVTAVRPPARFGAIKIRGNKVSYFKEKSSIDEGWINGGFFVMEPEIFNYIQGDKTYLEKEPLEKISKKKMLYAYKFKGFWQCMDTLRDKELLENYFKKKKIKF